MTLIVGIDCAAQPGNVGLARAYVRENLLVIRETRVASAKEPPELIIRQWIESEPRALLALDAPLGWPAALGAALANHRAGGPLDASANELFRRRTDNQIHARLGRRPLDIGADRIARAAHSALNLLQRLRERLSIPIDLAWSADWPGRCAAIEVYPAATRVALGVAKGKGSIAGLESRLEFLGPIPQVEHARDAVVCALTGKEFLSGRCVPPPQEDRETASREGWIWANECSRA